MGGNVAAWVAGFTIMEDAVDRLRGRVDAVNTTVAAMGLAGGFCLWRKFFRREWEGCGEDISYFGTGLRLQKDGIMG